MKDVRETLGEYWRGNQRRFPEFQQRFPRGSAFRPVLFVPKCPAEERISPNSGLEFAFFAHWSGSPHRLARRRLHHQMESCDFRPSNGFPLPEHRGRPHRRHGDYCYHLFPSRWHNHGCCASIPAGYSLVLSVRFEFSPGIQQRVRSRRTDIPQLRVRFPCVYLGWGILKMRPAAQICCDNCF